MKTPDTYVIFVTFDNGYSHNYRGVFWHEITDLGELVFIWNQGPVAKGKPVTPQLEYFGPHNWKQLSIPTNEEGKYFDEHYQEDYV